MHSKCSLAGRSFFSVKNQNVENIANFETAIAQQHSMTKIFMFYQVILVPLYQPLVKKMV